MNFYYKFKKKKAWGISTAQLLQMPKNTFGHHLGLLLHSNCFELIPKVERHDAYHLVTGFSTPVKDEIALQYTCFANGKRIPYLLGVLTLGTLLLPDHLTYYRKAYQYGRALYSFHQYDYKTILPLDFKHFKTLVMNKKATTIINS